MDGTFGGGEIVTWEAVRDLAPFGLRGEWVRFAARQMLTANAHRDAKTRPTPYTINDFLPEWLRYEAGEGGEGMEAMVAYLNASWE